jgi:hypothetical protein
MDNEPNFLGEVGGALIILVFAFIVLALIGGVVELFMYTVSIFDPNKEIIAEPTTMENCVLNKEISLLYCKFGESFIVNDIRNVERRGFVLNRFITYPTMTKEELPDEIKDYFKL